jgi:hypothetical protein
MKKFFLLLLFITSSCSKWSGVEEVNGIHKISDIDITVHSAKMIDWQVGTKRGATISKGVSFKVDIPKIDSHGQNVLYKNYGIDSWIYAISRFERGRKQHLGYVVFDLANISRSTTDLTIHIFYHAASVSQQFRNFHCPAFNHRLLIDKFEIVKDSPGKFDIFTRAPQEIMGQITRPSFAPVIFSAGVNLVGRYFVELALFNSKEKRIYTQFKRIPHSLDISSEQPVSVPSCIGIKEEEKPLKESLYPTIRDLEIK